MIDDRLEEIKVAETSKLVDQVAVVTGAGSSGPGFGTGKAISVLFAREGAKVVLVDKFEDRAKETLSLIEQEGGEAVVMTADVAEVSTAQHVIDAAVGHFGRVDILVNNAAVASSTGILDTTPELYQQIVAVNLTAPFMLSKAVIPIMLQGGGGAIVNITSIAAVRGQGSSQTAYAATKAGLMGLMVDLADAFGKQNIRVNCIAPGIIDTPMRARAMTEAGLDPKLVDVTRKVSLPFQGDAWDIARAALFLAGPDGRYLTGVLLPVDGGNTARSH
jgi:NAD(P)-dependent dehydrogenase (short-subunit alcohol dehydrogenase family)